jgi:hypothetical protein
MQDSGKPEDAGTAKPEGAGTEATRETISRRRGSEETGRPGDLNPRQSRKVWERGATRNHTERRNWKCGAEGQPKAPAPETPKDARREATRESVAGKAGRCRKRGNPRNASAGATGNARPRGYPKLTRQMRRRMRDSRRLEDPSPARPEDAEAGATRRKHREAQTEN